MKLPRSQSHFYIDEKRFTRARCNVKWIRLCAEATTKARGVQQRKQLAARHLCVCRMLLVQAEREQEPGRAARVLVYRPQLPDALAASVAQSVEKGHDVRICSGIAVTVEVGAAAGRA